MTELLINGPEGASCTIALAHGAGAPMDSDFMNEIAGQLAGHGYRVARFEFPYMERRRKAGSKGAPDREPVLRSTWLDVIAGLSRPLVIGGKSMGGRIASLVADEAQVEGLVCYGYPFHPVGKPDKLRVDHLRTIKTPTLILQGQRDPFGNAEHVPDYDLPRKVRVRWMKDGDHSFKPRKSSGTTLSDNLSDAVMETIKFIQRLKVT